MDDVKIVLLRLACAVVLLLIQVWIFNPTENFEARFWNALLHVSRRIAYASGKVALEAEANYYESVSA